MRCGGRLRSGRTSAETTAIGASANVVVLGIAMRSGSPISFWEFTRKGAIVTGVTILLAAPYLWLRISCSPGDNPRHPRTSLYRPAHLSHASHSADRDAL